MSVAVSNAIKRSNTIVLTEKEDKLFTLLDQFSKSLKQSSNIEVECRVAGGWVRDKLLGAESHDVDIALSSMMGVPFAQQFIPYVRSCGIDAHDPHIIRQNPDQSKHLETATAVILGADVDFVNLRSEEYAGDSRIPSSIKFGTPLQDALRRDINFNALFYNVHTRSVEDFLGKGLDDLHDGLVRTPLSPKQTFLDDPLRVLRCIRFASRFGFRLDPSVIVAAKDPEIQAALAEKVSRERFGIELDKMLNGRDPMNSITLLAVTCLIETLFTLPHSAPFEPPEDFRATLRACRILHSLLDPHPQISLPRLHSELSKSIERHPDVKSQLYLASMLMPWVGITYKSAKGRVFSAAAYVIDSALKLGRSKHHYLDGIPAMFEGLPRLISPALERHTSPSPRVALGLLLKDHGVHDLNKGIFWTSSTLFALVHELTGLWSNITNSLDATRSGEKIAQYNAFVDRLQELNLPATFEQKPLLTVSVKRIPCWCDIEGYEKGKDICILFDTKQSGPWLGHAIQKVVEWQLEFPNGTKEEANVWLLEQAEAGHINPPGSRETKRQRVDDGRG